MTSSRPLLIAFAICLCSAALYGEEPVDFEPERSETFEASSLQGPSRIDPDVKDPPPEDESIDDPQMSGPFAYSIPNSPEDWQPVMAHGTAATIAAQIPAEWRDQAFDRYVDAALLGQAWSTQDAAVLTDAALQIAEGERILMRAHKSTPADKLLVLAAKLARDSNDQATLERLAKAAKHLGKQELTAQLQSSRKLAGAARNTGLSVTLDDLSADEVSAYATYSKRIKAARIAGDGAMLSELAEEISGNVSLQEQRREYLLQVLEEAATAVPKDAQPDKVVQTLSKLGDASRGILDGTPLDNTPLDPGTWIPKDNSTGSGLQVVVPPYIDHSGNIWSGSGDGSQGRIVGKAQMQWSVSTGAAYWVSNYSNIWGRVASPKRADARHDRGATNSNVTSIPLTRYSISSSGETYYRSAQGATKFMGQAQRKKSNKTGKYAWVYTLGDGRQVYRYDDGKTNGG